VVALSLGWAPVAGEVVNYARKEAAVTGIGRKKIGSIYRPSNLTGATKKSGGTGCA
jgi:hypothetical protein